MSDTEARVLRPKDGKAGLLEIISPAGFERYFEEIVDMGGVAAMTPEALGELRDRYSLEMDLESVPVLAERFGLRLPPKR